MIRSALPSVDQTSTERPSVDNYIWFDPGKTTGWATWSRDLGFSSGQGDAFNVEDLWHENLWFDGVFNRDKVTVQVVNHVGWELFLITPGSSIKHDGSALKVIGFLEWVTRHFNCRVLDPQPSSARNLGRSGGKLQRLGWHSRGQDHANDAAAHLLAYLLREGKLSTELLRLLLPEVD